MNEYYADVVTMEKRRLRVSWRGKKKPTNEQMMDILMHEKYDDVTDEETLEIMEVRGIEYSE